MSRVCAVIGAQYGSEGKGVIVHHVADRYGVHVRVGGPNAGHSFVHDGKLWKMRSLPCGWTNPKAKLVIGPGALLDAELLEREITEVESAGYSVRDRLYVDERAGLITEMDRWEARNQNAVARYGSTGEGVGQARMLKLGRDPDRFYRVLDFLATWTAGTVLDTSLMLKGLMLDQSADVLLEGTQGCHLSLTHGPWPFVTNADTNAGTLCADAGIAPGRLTDVILVARSFPIRVGGNSGPLENEISWEELSAEVGRRVEEFTTVTNRRRRVGRWSDALLSKAIWLNAPTALAITFLDYWFPETEGNRRWSDLSRRAQDKVFELEEKFGVPVQFIGTGGDGFQVVELAKLAPVWPARERREPRAGFLRDPR